MTGFLLPTARPEPLRTAPAAGTLPGPLPPVTLFVPLYRETEDVLRRAARWPALLDYPAELLTVYWLVDERYEDDVRTAERIAPLARYGHGSRSAIVLPVPDMSPKAKALNHVFPQASGTVIGIYDADSTPAPDQVRLAVAALADGPDIVDSFELPGVARGFTNEATLAGTCCFFSGMKRLNQLSGFHMLQGSSLFFHHDVVARVGPLRESGVEEFYEWALRAADRGVTMGSLPSFTQGLPTGGLRGGLRQRTRWIRGQLEIGASSWRTAPGRVRLAVALISGSVLLQLLLPLLLLASVVFPVLWAAPAVLLAAEGVRVWRVSRMPQWKEIVTGRGWLFLVLFEALESVAAWRAVAELALGRDTWHSVRPTLATGRSGAAARR